MASKAKTNLTKLIAAKRAQLQEKDGRDFVAMAIASVNPKVTVDCTGATLRVSPANLLAGKLGGPAAGLKQKRAVDTFKANLARLLPRHAAGIREIPCDPSLPASDVASYVSALLREKAPAPAITTPSWSAFQMPTVMVRSASAEARAQISNLFGKPLAEKASDRLIQALRVASGFGREQSVSPRPVIVEFDAPAVTAAPVAAREGMAPSSGRQSLINAIRDQSYEMMSPLRAEIDKRAGAITPGRESLGPAELD